MLWLLVWPTGVSYSLTIYLLDFSCSGIPFYLLLSPFLISFLYLDLYVLGDDALIS